MDLKVGVEEIHKLRGKIKEFCTDDWKTEPLKNIPCGTP
jgi:hypothetical protein